MDSKEKMEGTSKSKNNPCPDQEGTHEKVESEKGVLEIVEVRFKPYRLIFLNDVPVQNIMTRHFMSFHVMSQIDDSLVQIDTKFRDHSMSFIQVLFVFCAGT